MAKCNQLTPLSFKGLINTLKSGITLYASWQL